MCRGLSVAHSLSSHTPRCLGAGLPSQALEAAETGVLRPNTTEERAAVLHAACAADCGSPVAFPQRLTRERAVSVSGGTSSPPRATLHSPDAGPCDGRTAAALRSLALHSGRQSALHRRPSRRQYPHGLSPRAPVNTFHSSAHPVIPRTPITPQLPVEMALTWGNTHMSFIHTVDNAWGKRHRPPVEPQGGFSGEGPAK